MSLSLFDIVGPVMLGPSSSHTAGANRIGYLAGRILGKIPQRVTIRFHEGFLETYAGHRTHSAIMAGLLGYREKDSAGLEALKEAREKGITLEIGTAGQEVHRNTMDIMASAGGEEVLVNGISLGGGSILITKIDGMEVNLDGNDYFLLIRSAHDVFSILKELLATYNPTAFFQGKTAGGVLLGCKLPMEMPQVILESLEKDVKGITVTMVSPLYEFREASSREAHFTNFREMTKCSGDRNLAQTALIYECQRTGRKKEEVLGGFQEILNVMKTSMEEGLRGQSQLIGGFCTGSDGKLLMDAYQGGRSVSGGLMGAAMARALAVAEVNAAAGKVVAAPTGGAAGVLPGVLLTLGENLGKSEEELIEGLLVASAVGVCIANKASLSGAVGGCQGEVGVGAAMAAAAAAYLGGADPEECIQAAVLTLKSILGLICDPPAGPVEVPCIKRNSMGVAVALMGADMALAGIKSVIPPDEVVDALVNTQQLLHQDLKGTTVGGLGCTFTADKLRCQWRQTLKTLE